MNNNLKPTFKQANEASARRNGAAHPATTAYFLALNESMRPSEAPHPIRARNVGLLPTWQKWVEWKERALLKPVARQLLPDSQVRFSVVNDRITDLTQDDLDLDEIVVDGPTIIGMTQLATAPLMYWARPHCMIVPTPGLQQLLAHSDLGGDIPATLLRPPAPACFILFGEEMRRVVVAPHNPDIAVCPEVEGVYIFESMQENRRCIALAPIMRAHGVTQPYIGRVDMAIDDEQRPLLDLIRENCTPKDNMAAFYQSVAQLCTMVFLYLGLPQAQRTVETPYTGALAQLDRLGPKKRAKLQRQAERLYDRILLGPREALLQDRGETAPHWRRGHFRMQPHGPKNSLRKVLFIAPVLVRADRLAAGAMNISATAKSNHTSR